MSEEAITKSIIQEWESHPVTQYIRQTIAADLSGAYQSKIVNLTSVEETALRASHNGGIIDGLEKFEEIIAYLIESCEEKK
jgi:hypothetical protein